MNFKPVEIAKIGIVTRDQEGNINGEDKKIVYVAGKTGIIPDLNKVLYCAEKREMTGNRGIHCWKKQGVVPVKNIYAYEKIRDVSSQDFNSEYPSLS